MKLKEELKKIFNSKIWLMVVSLFLALLLFFTATSSSSQSNAQGSGTTETYTQTLSNVAIDFKYDSDSYFISGYSYEAEVYMTSVNRVKLDSEVNSDTRSFKVVADLTGLEEGTHTVELQITNMPSGVNATVSPSSISVTIGKKASKTFSVKGIVESNQLATGYEIKKITTSDSQVEVTSSESIISQIDHVEACLPDDETLDGDYSGRVTLQAVSADGTVLAGVINPSKTTLSVTVKKLTKTVPVTLELTGDMDDTLSDISYTLSQDTVTISGDQETLDAINEVTATLDISKISKDTKRIITLSEDDVTIDPSSITVQLTVTKK